MASDQAIDRLFDVASRTQDDLAAFSAQMRSRMRAQPDMSDRDRRNLFLGHRDRILATHGPVRALYAAGVEPEEIAMHLWPPDDFGNARTRTVHQITHTDWCDVCATLEADTKRLSPGRHTICDRCVSLSHNALIGSGPSHNKMISFTCRPGEGRTCLFCRREAPAPPLPLPDGHGPDSPVAGLKLFQSTTTMIVGTPTLGDQVAMCDLCSNFYHERFQHPQVTIENPFPDLDEQNGN